MKSTIIILLLFLIAAAGEVIRELHVFRVTRYKIRHVKLAGLKHTR